MSEKSGAAGATSSKSFTRADPPTNSELRDIEALLFIMRELLGPDGCPWDRAQTLDTLRPYLLEETHEVLDAMANPQEHRKELGDLLFQIVFQSSIREREGQFDFGDVVQAISEKMIRRHPHVFAAKDNASKLTAQEVQAQWEEIKAGERSGTSNMPDWHGVFNGIPSSLPALQRASRIQEKAAALGFDWPDLQGPMDKLDEELGEMRAAIAVGSKAEMVEELGDVLFVLVRVAQKLGVNAHDALSGTIAKFEYRFQHVLTRCSEAEIDPRQAGLAQLDAFWNEAKEIANKSKRNST